VWILANVLQRILGRPRTARKDGHRDQPAATLPDELLIRFHALAHPEADFIDIRADNRIFHSDFAQSIQG
jgi:hypothetical protein